MLDGLDSFSSTSEKNLMVQFLGEIASNFLRLTVIKYQRDKINVSGDKTPRPLGQMLTSSRLNRTTQVDVVKTGLGAFHTKGSCWLNSVVSEFIVSTNLRRAIDPFAGNGDMLDLVGSKFSMQKSGYDIDDSTVWEVNDSLVSIPRSPGSICITNPPFLAKYSARRKSMWPMVGRYYERYGRNDLYEIALDRCLASFGHVVAILPETFLHSAYSKDRCERIIVLEENPFDDTTFPCMRHLLVACHKSRPGHLCRGRQGHSVFRHHSTQKERWPERQDRVQPSRGEHRTKGGGRYQGGR